MATSTSWIKCLLSTCEIVFHCICWLKFCNLYFSTSALLYYKHFLRGDIKEVIENSFQNSQINLRSNHPEVFCQKLFLKVLQNSRKNIFAGISFLIKLQAGKLKLSEVATGDAQ